MISKFQLDAYQRVCITYKTQALDNIPRPTFSTKAPVNNLATLEYNVMRDSLGFADFVPDYVIEYIKEIPEAKNFVGERSRETSAKNIHAYLEVIITNFMYCLHVFKKFVT